MTVLLGKLFRRLLSHSDRQVTAVADEIDFLRTYLRIEEVRFGARLRVRMNIDPAVSHETIPSLILQPVVENAIKHGLAPKTGPGNLTISANRCDGFVQLAVEDDGAGAAAAPLKQESAGVGLKNIAERLKTLYDGRASLRVEMSPGSGSRVTILIPSGEAAG
jgi:sensor histidine kinase YesM